jgi:hypothetical protein
MTTTPTESKEGQVPDRDLDKLGSVPPHAKPARSIVDKKDGHELDKTLENIPTTKREF